MSFAGLTQSDTKFLSDLQKKKDIEKENRRSGDVKAAEPCDVEKITIISSKNPDDSVNLTGGMIRFMYYESLLSNSIKATYTYSDSGNTANNAKTGSNNLLV